MTRKTDRSAPAARKSAPRAPVLGRWHLHDAKARFSELVRQAQLDGPQHITVHGRDAVVVIAAEAFNRLLGSVTGAALIDALQACPDQALELVPARLPMPVRDVVL